MTLDELRTAYLNARDAFYSDLTTESHLAIIGKPVSYWARHYRKVERFPLIRDLAKAAAHYQYAKQHGIEAYGRWATIEALKPIPTPKPIGPIIVDPRDFDDDV